MGKRPQFIVTYLADVVVWVVVDPVVALLESELLAVVVAAVVVAVSTVVQFITALPFTMMVSLIGT